MSYAQKMVWVPVLAGLAVLVGAAAPAEAVSYPMNLDTTGWYQYSGYYYTMGYKFRVDFPSVTVVQIGCYTPAPYARTVALWNSSGTLLAQATTPNTAGWTFATLATPVVLTQGAEYIVGEYGDGYSYKSNSWSGDGRITFVDSVYYYSSYVFPSISLGTWSLYGEADIGYTVMPPPPTPASITVPMTDYDGNYTISWTSAATASYYELQEDTNASFVNPVTVYNGANLSYNVTGKLNGTYYYRVRAGNLGGTSAWRTGANPCNVTLIPNPVPSLIVPVSSTTGNFFVSWSPVQWASSYDLEEYSTVSPTWTNVFSGASMSWSAVGQADGTYYYRVRSSNAAGQSTWTYGSYPGNPANPASPGDGCVVTKPPIAPPAISVPFNSTNGVYTVSWTASPSGAVAYRLEEDTDANFGSPTQIYLGLNTSFTVGGGPSPNDPRQNGSYYYRVRAENTGGPSGWTIGGNGCTVLLPPPAAPTSLTVPANSSTGTYTLTWTPSAGAMTYQLQEATDALFTGAMPVYSGTGLSHNVVGNPGAPPIGTTYYYRVRAWNSSGWSNWTTGANGCLVIVPVPGDVPTISVENTLGGGPAPQPDADGTYYVVWGVSSGATSYLVEESTNYPSFAGAATVFSGAGQNVLISGRGNGTYYYRVKGQNSSGMSTNWAVYSTGIQVLTPPQMPASISVPATSSTGGYQIVWTSSATATSYNLEESSDGGASWNPVYTGTNLYFDVSGKADGYYHYRVRATNSSGPSGWQPGSNPCHVLFPPATPGSITVPATSATGTYVVSWTASPTASRYDLEESADNQSTWSQVYTGPDTVLQFTVTGKVSGTYWYRVRSFNGSGYSATWRTSSNPCVIVAPATPTGLNCPATSSTGTWPVTWNPSVGAAGYTLEETSDGGVNWSVVYSGPNATFTVAGKTTGTFGYRVSASNGAGTSAVTGTVSCTMVAPPAPASVNVPPLSISGYFQVGWTASAGATSYSLEEGPSAAGPWTPGTYDGPNTSFYVTGKPNGTYWYRVRAFNAVGGSTWTVSGNGCVVNLAPPAAVATITVPATSVTGSYMVTWASSFGATGYELQEATLSNLSDAHTVYTGSSTGFFVSGRANGMYFYQVRATNPVGASAYTPGMNGCVVNLVPPGVPGNFAVPFSSFSGLYALTWTSGSGAIWYAVEEDTDPSFGAPRTVYLGGSLSCWILGRTNGTYYYRIRSVNPIGQSGWVRGGNGCMVAVVSPAIGLFGGPANPCATREVPGAAGVPVLQLAIATGTGGAVTIDSLAVRGSGTGDEASEVQAVRLWEDFDGDGVVSAGVDRALGTSQTFAADDGTVSFTALNETVPAGTVRYWLVAYDFQGGAMAGEDYLAEVTANGDMVARDAVWGSLITPQGAPVQGGTKTLSVFGTGDLQVFLGARSPVGRSVVPGTANEEMAQWNLVASSVEEVRVSRVTVWAQGDGDDVADVVQVRLVLDANGNGVADGTETVLGSGVFSSNNGSVAFALATPLSVPAGASRKLLAVYDFDGDIPGTWRFGAGLLTTGDLTTSGASSASPVSLMGPPVLGTYATVSTPPPPEAKVDPEYSMGGCSPVSGAFGAAGLAGWAAPWAFLVGALWLSRRRRLS